MDRVDYQSLVIQDIVNLHKKEELDIAPWYQRRSVWVNSQKSYLINTLFEQKPIPALYIRHSIDLEIGKSIKEIVDGQQRTRSVIEYCNDDFVAKHPEHKRKVKFSQLTTAQRQKFLLTSIPVGYLLGASDADVIDIFGRINSIAKTLNDQEKRNAAYSGEMKQFCLKQASTRISFWRSYSIFSANDIARMQEIQFISDIVYNMMHGLSDFSNSKINDMYKAFDDDFEEIEEYADKLDELFSCILEQKPDTIKNTIFCRQPLFFSLLIVLFEQGTFSKKKIEDALFKIDGRFNNDIKSQQDDDKEFIAACTSTTQRIAQRKVRHKFIIKHLGDATY